MLDSLPIRTKETEPNRRAELNSQLRVGDWAAPGQVVSPQRRGVPSWWTSEEEASDSFLKSMGIKLE